MDMTRDRIRVIAGLVVVAALLLVIPATNVAAYYIAFLYLIFFWISMATSWTILCGFAGYWSFGHAAFFGTGVYTAATLATKFNWPFLWTFPAAGLLAAALGTGIGWLVFRLQRLRGELFALITISVTFVVATIISNTPIDGGSGVYLISVSMPELFGSQNGTIYTSAWPLRAHADHHLLGLSLADGARPLRHPRRRGRRRGQRRADLPLQARRLRADLGHRRRGRRRLFDQCQLRHRRRDLRDHGDHVSGGDEHFRRLAPLARPGARRDHRHDRALRLPGRPGSGAGARRRRARPDRGRAAAARWRDAEPDAGLAQVSAAQPRAAPGTARAADSGAARGEAAVAARHAPCSNAAMCRRLSAACRR